MRQAFRPRHGGPHRAAFGKETCRSRPRLPAITGQERLRAAMHGCPGPLLAAPRAGICLTAAPARPVTTPRWSCARAAARASAPGQPSPPRLPSDTPRATLRAGMAHRGTARAAVVPARGLQPPARAPAGAFLHGSGGREITGIACHGRRDRRGVDADRARGLAHGRGLVRNGVSRAFMRSPVMVPVLWVTRNLPDRTHPAWLPRAAGCCRTTATRRRRGSARAGSRSSGR